MQSLDVLRENYWLGQCIPLQGEHHPIKSMPMDTTVSPTRSQDVGGPNRSQTEGY